MCFCHVCAYVHTEGDGDVNGTCARRGCTLWEKGLRQQIETETVNSPGTVSTLKIIPSGKTSLLQQARPEPVRDLTRSRLGEAKRQWRAHVWHHFIKTLEDI